MKTFVILAIIFLPWLAIIVNEIKINKLRKRVKKLEELTELKELCPDCNKDTLLKEHGEVLCTNCDYSRSE